MYAYEGILTRYQINLTDHAFWLGAGCCDICINFREYGANISKEYRGIPESKNVITPLYPIIDYGKEFQGFPFDVQSGQKIMFSGGSLYKTFGKGNKYYKMVDEILSRHNNIIFWYAGEGDDSELIKLSTKYPNRVFHTHERSDLFQLLSKCDLFLSTYPLTGGLMFQYAAMAGLVPLTLVHDSCSDGFWPKHLKNLVMFDSTEELYSEVDRLLQNENYAKKRGDLMKQAVISPSRFDEMTNSLVSGIFSELIFSDYTHIDTGKFKSTYLERLCFSDIATLAARKSMKNVAIRYFPFTYVRGRLHRRVKLWRRSLCSQR